MNANIFKAQSPPSMPSIPSSSSMPAPHPFAGAGGQFIDPHAMPMPVPVAPVIVPRNNAPRTIKALCGRFTNGKETNREAIILRTNVKDTLEAFKRVFGLTDEDVKDVIFFVEFKGSDTSIRVDEGAWEALMEQEDLSRMWIGPRSLDAWQDWYKGSFKN